MLALVASSACAAGGLLPASPDSYLSQAARVRQSADRPWLPEDGRLGNLRHLRISAKDCAVRILSGTENRVFPGRSDVVLVEQSRVLDTAPDEQPTPRDVVLAPDHAQACPAVGSCGLSITSLPRGSGSGSDDAACFTVQIATAHDLLLGGDGLTVLVDRVHQPALRISINPGFGQRLWLEQARIGLLSISANAPVRVGGNGQIDFLQAGSSNGGSVMLLHEFRAQHVGVSTTTTGTHWSVHIGADTTAGYYQPARAPGSLAKNYGIEVDGPLDRLDMPAGRVDPSPLAESTRIAARALRQAVLAKVGTARELASAEPGLPLPTAAAAALPIDPREHVAQVVARYLPASTRITDVALWRRGGRLEGVAADVASARDVVRLLRDSGEFTYVSGGGGSPRAGGYAFSAQLNFSCDAPGEPSECPAGESPHAEVYSEAQVRGTLDRLVGDSMTLLEVRLDGQTIHLRAAAASESEARAALERIRQQKGLFRVSISSIGRSGSGPAAEISATLKLNCVAPPKPDGICSTSR